MGNGFRHDRRACKMHDRVNRVFFKDPRQQGLVADVTAIEACLGGTAQRKPVDSRSSTTTSSCASSNAHVM